MTRTLKTLILVHPGSACGSADYNVGWGIAGRVRGDIQEKLEAWEGHVVVLDGYLSVEIYRGFADQITRALRRARESGALGLRLWGDDAGEDPYDDWQGLSRNNQPAIFENQEDAARWLATWLQSEEIVVTGAWATKDGRSGCVNAVVDVLRERLPYADVQVCASALYQEYMYDDDDGEEEVCIDMDFFPESDDSVSSNVKIAPDLRDTGS